MTNPNLWNQLLIWPLTNILVGFYRLFEVIHIPWPLGWSVISVTLLVRLILYPLMNVQMRSAKKMANLKPHLDALNVKHKDDKKALQQAQLELYKEHGVNPAAGCLPLLVQMPFLIAIYNVFNLVLNAKDLTAVVADINKIVYFPWLKISGFDMSYFGIDLALKPSQFQTHGWWLLSIPIITAGLQWYQQKLMMPSFASADAKAMADKKASDGKPSTSTIKTSENKNALAKPEEKPAGDQAAEMQKQMAIISPLMFGFFALQFPLGLALYWNVFGLFGIMQQLRINKHS
jgi:YidC/Oxa1 family membrane protein insertase